MDQRDSACERLGDLAASVAPDDDRLPDARTWARIGRQLDRRPSWRSPRRLVPVLALCMAFAVGGGWLVARRPLGYRVQGCQQVPDGAVCPSAGSVAFADGTRIALDPGARLRIMPLARGAELFLDDGAASLAVVHRTRARWTVAAGPFRIEVTGTRFSVDWSRSRQVLDVAVREGEVHVTGGTLVHAAVLRAGQSLRADLHPQAATQEQVAVPLPAPVASPTSSAPSGTATSLGAHPSTARAPNGARPSRRWAEATPDAASAGRGAAPSASAQRSQARALATRAGDRSQARLSPASADVPSHAAPAATTSWPSTGSLGVSASEAARQAQPVANRVVLGSDGRLDGGMTGHTWLARGEGTTLSAPASQEDHLGLRPDADGLCTSGTVAGLSCVNENIPSARCNWDRNWGVAIGLDVRADGEAWGDQAARSIAVEFHGRSSNYRLNAHKRGDPPPKVYCIDNYKSGRRVTPSMFKSRCWSGEGDTLPDFKSVDQFNLQFPSGMDYVAFHYCISGIRVER
jgi:hypothetical protein